MSTKTGWAVINSKSDGSYELVDYGQIPQVHMPQGTYPEQFVVWAYQCFGEILELIETYVPDVLVIEETAAGSKAIYTQKILEWIHFLVARFIRDTNIKAVYIKTEEWRREIGCVMSKTESKRNKTVREYKKKNKTSIAYDDSGKRIGKITRKHVNIRRANEIFGKFLHKELRKKDEDLADALGLAAAYHQRKSGIKL
jgi:Holliday junction resolvasome RuvABC endonuclease subunit